MKPLLPVSKKIEMSLDEILEENRRNLEKMSWAPENKLLFEPMDREKLVYKNPNDSFSDSSDSCKIIDSPKDSPRSPPNQLRRFANRKAFVKPQRKNSHSRSRSRSRSRSKSQEKQPSKRHKSCEKNLNMVVKFNNLPISINWRILKRLCEQYGKVIRADIERNEMGKNTGKGKILVSTQHDAKKIFNALNEKVIGGKKLELKFGE